MHAYTCVPSHMCTWIPLPWHVHPHKCACGYFRPDMHIQIPSPLTCTTPHMCTQMPCTEHVHPIHVHTDTLSPDMCIWYPPSWHVQPIHVYMDTLPPHMAPPHLCTWMLTPIQVGKGGMSYGVVGDSIWILSNEMQPRQYWERWWEIVSSGGIVSSEVHPLWYTCRGFSSNALPSERWDRINTPVSFPRWVAVSWGQGIVVWEGTQSKTIQCTRGKIEKLIN